MLNRPTLHGLGVLLEELQRARDDVVEAVLDRRGHARGVHLHERAESHDAQLLVVHARKARRRSNSREPLIEERARGAGPDLLEELQRRGGVVQDRVDEDVVVCDLERLRVRLVHDGVGGGHNRLKSLKIRAR